MVNAGSGTFRTPARSTAFRFWAQEVLDDDSAIVAQNISYVALSVLLVLYPSAPQPIWTAIDHNLSASAARKACSAGIIADPGSLAAPARLSTSRRTRSGTNKNSPPQLVINCVPGASVKVRTSATGSTVGAGPTGRSSSRRRGSGAKPSARNTSRTAVGLKGILRSLSTSAIS